MSNAAQNTMVERQLGGEAGHRSFFGGAGKGPRNILLGLCGVGMVVGTPFFGATAVVIAIIAAAIVFLVTARTHRGSILDRRERRVRWKDRRRAGIDRYTPFDVAQWDQLTQLTQDKTASKQDRWAAARDLAAMRTMPDGADGMGWLQMGRREPGIAWHAPMGEKPYLSVVFTVTGQLRGVEPNSVARRAAEAFGEFLASRAAPSSLLRRASPERLAAVLSFGDIELDRDKHRVARSGRPIDLGPTEYRLLEFFLEHPGRVFSREQLLDSVWGRDIYIDERTVDVHIGRLRKLLNPDGTTLAGIQIDMPQNYKTYWKTPGQTGIPTQIDLAGSKGVDGYEIL